MSPSDAPTPQRLPGGVCYDNHGSASKSEPLPANPKCVYIDVLGNAHPAEVVIARKGGNYDISYEGQRRDGVGTKQDESQTGDYLIFPDAAEQAKADTPTPEAPAPVAPNPLEPLPLVEAPVPAAENS